MSGHKLCCCHISQRLSGRQSVITTDCSVHACISISRVLYSTRHRGWWDGSRDAETTRPNHLGVKKCLGPGWNKLYIFRIPSVYLAYNLQQKVLFQIERGNFICAFWKLKRRGYSRFEDIKVWRARGHQVEIFSNKKNHKINLYTVIKLYDSKSAIFIARQHTDARYWYSNFVQMFVRLYVRPLRSGILWKRLKIFLQFFSPHGSPIILVLRQSNIFAQFGRRHPCRGDKYMWGIKISRFWPISRYISQTIQDSAIVTMEL